MKHYQCCGFRATFYEKCGCTTTEEDHHRACIHQSLEPQSSEPRLVLFPAPYPKCSDLHRYIRLVDSKCRFCRDHTHKTGERILTSSKSHPRRNTMSEGELLDRGVYWLNELLLAREEEYQGKFSDWEISLNDRQNIEASLQIPFSKRTFAYDPSVVRGNFLRKVNPSDLTAIGKKRYVGRD